MRVVVTGASSGIGAALARLYAGPGTTLALLARRGDALAALAAELPGTVVTYPGDITDSDYVARTAADFISRFGPPDLVIANAGISIGTLGDDPDDVAKLRRVLEVNVVGLAATLAGFVPSMRAAGRGTLAGIASVAGFRGLPGAGAYSASKAAAILWMESLRVELAGSGVAVVTVCPGYIDTPMTRVNTYAMPFIISAEDAARRIAKAIAAKRRLAVIPWRMALLSILLRTLPGWLFDRLTARAPRKPRHLPL